MKSFITAAVLILIISNYVYPQDEASKYIAAGDSLFKLYDNPGALKAYLSALAVDSLNYEAQWKASRAYVDVGETIEDDDQRAEYYLKGNYTSAPNLVS